MDNEKWLRIWTVARRYVLNKYLITCIIFAFVLAFCGEHSLVKRIARQRQIHDMEQQLKTYKQQTIEYKQNINAIQDKPQELERFAREQFYMHADNEDVYVIKED